MAGLSKRLAAVAGHVPQGAVVADIGTDHAYLAIHLIGEGRASRVVAGDVNRGPYEAAQANVRSRGLEQSIDLRIGDGLKVLKPGEVDVVVLAGLGGCTICNILDDGRPVLERLKRLVIQPMRDIALVRRWLLENGWRIADEEMVCEDGHYYVVIVAEPGAEIIKDDFLLEVGPRLLEKRDPVLHDFLVQRLSEIRAVLEEITKARGDGVGCKAGRLRQKAEKIKEVLEQWK
jgi:tRNA (adenine22-N1)-methyltransferase